MSPKCCAKFGFDLEQATVVCCIVEFFFAYVHVLVACCVVLLAPLRYFEILMDRCTGVKYDINGKIPPTDDERFCRRHRVITPGLDVVQWILFGTYVIYFIGLLVQAAFSIPLYLIGYKKKNVTIITTWIVIAAINYLCPAILFFGSFATDDLGSAKHEKSKHPATGGIPKQIGFIFFYMFYLDIGFAVFLAYRKHLKQGRNIASGPVPEKAMETLDMKTEASEIEVFSADLASAGEDETPSVENV